MAKDSDGIIFMIDSANKSPERDLKPLYFLKLFSAVV